MNCKSESRMYRNGMMADAARLMADAARLMADAARLSLAACAGCFVTAGFGCDLDQFFPDAIYAEGLTVISCFYLTIGVVDQLRVRLLEAGGESP